MVDQYSVQIHAFGSKSGLALLNEIADHARRWAARSVGEGGPRPDAPTGQWEANGQSLQFEAEDDGIDGVFALDWIIESERWSKAVRTLQWNVSIRLATSGNEVAIEARVRTNQPGGAGTDATLERRFASVALVGELAAAYDCRSGQTAVTAQHRDVTPQDLDDFVEASLLDPQRELPIVAVSENRNGELSLDPTEVQRRPAGLALVVTFGTDVSRELAQRIGRRSACYGGAVRVYRPNMNRQDDPGRHRYWLGSQLEPGDFRIRNELLAHTARIAVEYEIDSVYDRLHERFRVDEMTRLRTRLAESAAAPSADADAFLELLDEVQAQLDRVTKERDHWRTIAEQLRSQPGPQPVARKQPSTVREVLDQAIEQCGGLRFLESARYSADDSAYRPALKVLDALVKLNELSAELRSDKTINTGILSWLKQSNFDASPESDATMHRYGDQRRFRDADGRLLEMPFHIKLGGGRGGHARCRIHFLWDKEDGQIIVGHVGRHLRTSQG